MVINLMRYLFTLLFAIRCIGIEYYVDYSGGNDTNNGTTVLSCWQHLPKDIRATGVSSNTTIVAGDIIYFKKGVTYDFSGHTYSGIVFANSGTLIATGNSASMSSVGLLTDTNRNFTASNVVSGNWLYVYNADTNYYSLETCGFWKITNVAQTQLTVEGFNGTSYSSNLLSYIVVKPIAFTTTNTFGSGKAILSGGTNADALFRTKNYYLFSDLEMCDLRDADACGCTNQAMGCIWDNNNRNGIFVQSVNFSNVYKALHVPGAYQVAQNCSVTNFGYFGFVCGDYCLIQDNVTYNGCRSVGNASAYAVIRRNTFIKNDSCGCGNHSNGIGVIFGSEAPIGGIIYNNWIEGPVVQGIYLTRGSTTNSGTRSWVIANNVVIGYYGMGESGVTAIGVTASPGTRVYNNLVVGAEGKQGWASAAIGIGGNDDNTSLWATNISVYNNILINHSMIAFKDHCTNGLIVEGNLYYNYDSGSLTPFESFDDTFNTNFAGWKIMGYDNAGYSTYGVDPKFIDVTNFNFRLQSDSPAIGSPYSLTVNIPDMDRNIRTGLWDRGPYQFTNGTIIHRINNMRVGTLKIGP